MNSSNIAIFFFLVSLFLLPLSLAVSVVDHHLPPQPAGNETAFSYIEATGRGPSRWGQLDPNWGNCSLGRMQSPINIQQNIQILFGQNDLIRDYKPAFATIRSRGFYIEVEWKEDAGKITINGTDYKLKQLHWHTPTEHAFSGTRFEVELHVVHSNSRGQMAVISILYRLGLPDPFLLLLFPFLRVVTREETPLGLVDASFIVPRTGNYYRYNGSLTTPPCFEGVVWTVFQQVRTVSAAQVQALKNAVDPGFQMNARPIQDLNGRTVSLYIPPGF